MNLQQYREAHGLTRAQLARAIGVAWVTLWKWEERRARPSYEHLTRISEVTNNAVCLTEIIGELPKRRGKA